MTKGSPPAVEVAGFLKSGLGLGEAARLYVDALRAAGVPVHTRAVDLDLPSVDSARQKTVDFEDVEHAGECPVSLICVNAPELGHFRAQVGDAFFDRPWNIGSWAWEVDKVPAAWRPMLGVFDEIWVYSQYVVDNLEPVAQQPVVRVPLPIVEPAVTGPPPDFGLPDRFTFLFMFDFFSTLPRKNPIGLVEAFKRAFSPGEGPQLLLKSFNGDYKPERLAEVQAAAAGHPDIHIVDRYVTAAEKDALVAACDCYVSLHRAEGFGLTLGEAMVLGKPVIATNFSGNTDFMTSENSYLVDWRLTEVGPGGENYPPDGHWAEPDLGHAAATMRDVWENADQARARGARAREDTLTNWSLEAVGRLARERLAGAVDEASRDRFRPPRVLPRPPGHVEWAQQKLAYDPDEDAEAGRARSAARRLALQAMRPYTHHQDELNALVVGGLREISQRLDELAAQFTEGLNDLRQVQHAMRARPGQSHPAITRETDAGEEVLAFDRSQEDANVASVEFEDIFRGSEELIRERQREYVDMLGHPEWVLDLGCGRGEFLDLLGEAGIRGRGIDVDPERVARCRAKGHDAEVADAVDHLESLEASSVPALFAAQVIEHLAWPDLNRLFQLAADRMAPGGMAIFETVNPHCASALKAFWTDPTHQHPLFPEVVLALARFAGFETGRVHFRGGSGRLDEDLYSCPDYAVICRMA